MDKPQSIAASEFRSAKWDEITSGRRFSESDIPAIVLLISWYEVVEKCIDDITYGDGVQVAYQNDMGDLKAMPQLATMKQASAEIRALNKQLGINDSHVGAQVKDTPLQIIVNRRKDARRAANA
ncbi:MAG: hypothetical protein IJR41_04815 [Atopobiaceae bacterium]|nr:hypothetical protein [Atopobiaceae bacterium]